MARAWLIDASIYIFRAWFSLPDDRWFSHDGFPVQAVYGYTRFLLDFVEHAGPGFHGAAAFDESLGSNFRNDIYPDYKSSRALPDEALALQLDACRRITELMGIPCYGGARYEADDYLASLAQLFQAGDIPVTVVTRDKDLGQILRGPEDHWWDYAGDVTLDAQGFFERFGVAPTQFADYLALVGDPVDDIPGVPGVGAKTAAALLQAFGDIGQLYSRLDELPGLKIRGAAKIRERLLEQRETVAIARRLTGLERRVPGVNKCPAAAVDARSLERVSTYLDDLNLSGPLTDRCRRLQQTLLPGGVRETASR